MFHRSHNTCIRLPALCNITSYCPGLLDVDYKIGDTTHKSILQSNNIEKYEGLIIGRGYFLQGSGKSRVIEVLPHIDMQKITSKNLSLKIAFLFDFTNCLCLHIVYVFNIIYKHHYTDVFNHDLALSQYNLGKDHRSSPPKCM